VCTAAAAVEDVVEDSLDEYGSTAGNICNFADLSFGHTEADTNGSHPYSLYLTL